MHSKVRLKGAPVSLALGMLLVCGCSATSDIGRLHSGRLQHMQGSDDDMLADMGLDQGEARLWRVDGDADALRKADEQARSLEQPQPALVSPLLENEPYPPKLELASSRSVFDPMERGRITANPSLWPDEGQGASMFRDFRAFQKMDVITVVINERSEGKKKAETDTESEFSLLAGITEFFGLETSKLAANNTSLDPTALVQARTNAEFESEGETGRSGSLQARISAVIVDVLPNGLLKFRGKKVVSVNDEEEILVISGLVRNSDINANNQVDSSRVANMRIDFFGRGVVASEQTPGWLYNVFKVVWPF